MQMCVTDMAMHLGWHLEQCSTFKFLFNQDLIFSINLNALSQQQQQQKHQQQHTLTFSIYIVSILNSYRLPLKLACTWYYLLRRFNLSSFCLTFSFFLDFFLVQILTLNHRTISEFHIMQWCSSYTFLIGG